MATRDVTRRSTGGGKLRHHRKNSEQFAREQARHGNRGSSGGVLKRGEYRYARAERQWWQ